MRLTKLDSNFLHYLIESDLPAGSVLPPLADISEGMGVSVGKLREEVSAAKAMGIVSVKPRVGTKREPFNFLSSVLPGILYGLATDEATFAQLSQLRRGIETSLWEVAVPLLSAADLDDCRALILKARALLDKGRIPYQEHRAFHLGIFGRIENPFAIGLLKAYWEVYEASEFSRYQPMSYWLTVWDYHERIIEGIAVGDISGSRQLMIDHFNLLKTTPSSVTSNGSANAAANDSTHAAATTKE